MSRLRSALLVGLGIAVLAVPAGAFAALYNEGPGPGNAEGHAKGKAKGHAQGKGKGQSRRGIVGYVFKGFYAGEGAVDVKKGNAHVRKHDFVGETVEFDLDETRFVVRDVNGDGERNLDDVAIGDWVLVKARLPRKDPGDQPFEAKRLIDKSSFNSSEDSV